jgi:GT2 family glycosyltransferase
LTISVISHNHGPLLDALLEDLLQTGALNQCQVIVTMNVPDPGFPLAKWRDGGSIEWIHNVTPKGFGANHNSALLQACTSWVLVMNPDIRITEGTLEGLLADHVADADVGIVAPQVVSTTGEIEDSVRCNLTPTALFKRSLRRVLRLPIARPARKHIEQADWFAGMFLLIPSHVYAAVGGFHERFFLYCEDYDICARISLLGKRLVLDDRYSVTHNARHSSHRKVQYFGWHIRSLLTVWCSVAFWKYSIGRALGRLPGITRTGHLD